MMVPCGSYTTDTATSGQIYYASTWLQEDYQNEFDKRMREIEARDWERDCWALTVQEIVKPRSSCVRAQVVRRLMFHMSGWLAEKGQKKRSGK